MTILVPISLAIMPKVTLPKWCLCLFISGSVPLQYHKPLLILSPAWAYPFSLRWPDSGTNCSGTNWLFLSFLCNLVVHTGKCKFPISAWLLWSTTGGSLEIDGYYVTSMEKAMATHSSTLAWKIPWTEEPGRLQSMESLRVGHN